MSFKSQLFPFSVADTLYSSSARPARSSRKIACNTAFDINTCNFSVSVISSSTAYIWPLSHLIPSITFTPSSVGAVTSRVALQLGIWGPYSTHFLKYLQWACEAIPMCNLSKRFENMTKGRNYDLFGGQKWSIKLGRPLTHRLSFTFTKLTNPFTTHTDNRSCRFTSLWHP